MQYSVPLKHLLKIGNEVLTTTAQTLSGAVNELKSALDGLATVARTGKYIDLVDAPVIPAEQIQSDWNQSDTASKDFIKNKPASMPSVWGSISGNLSDQTDLRNWIRDRLFEKLDGKSLYESNGTPGEDRGAGVANRYVPAMWWITGGGYTGSDGGVFTFKVPSCGGHVNGIYLSTNDGNPNYYPIVYYTRSGANGIYESRLTTHFPAGSYISVVFEETSDVDVYDLGGSDNLNHYTWGVYRIINMWDANDYTRQVPTSGNANYEVLFSYGANNTDATSYTRKNSNLLFNPSTGNLQTTKLNGITLGSPASFIAIEKFTSASKTLAADGTTSFTVSNISKSGYTPLVALYASNNQTSAAYAPYPVVAVSSNSCSFTVRNTKTTAYSNCTISVYVIFQKNS